ncbi:hypothetical protein VPAG_00029 [Vibrio phage douglas 12A4]|uniref:hypothetical protein n=1 Tax=Vibrio phage douglas 12A4 TaxID=573171 RepID=UPI0002C082A2|nr:hypothetical protein VPAG_00029 [Vibrio phage douglas 12A4]AGG58065.1 hypothetical protein VPAG_00029 [Vibrio phage douglas 12A4]
MRLNKQIRESIVRNALIKAEVIIREEAIIDSTAELAEAVRIFHFGGKKKIEEGLAIFEEIKLVQGKITNMLNRHATLDSSYYVRANFAGMQTVLYFNGYTEGIDCDREYINKVPSTNDRVNIPQGHKLVDKFNKLETEKKAVKELRESITLQVNAATKTIGTVEKLLKVWPEAKELLPKKELQAASMPVVQTKELNNLIGLPS